MPAIGMSSFESDQLSATEITKAVKGAVTVGYWHSDRASVYGIEAAICNSFEEILRGGVKRDEFRVNSKLLNDKYGEDQVIALCRQSLADLPLKCLDLASCIGLLQFFIRRAAMCDRLARTPDRISTRNK